MILVLYTIEFHTQCNKKHIQITWKSIEAIFKNTKNGQNNSQIDIHRGTKNIINNVFEFCSSQIIRKKLGSRQPTNVLASKTSENLSICICNAFSYYTFNVANRNPVVRVILYQNEQADQRPSLFHVANTRLLIAWLKYKLSHDMRKPTM